MGLDELLELAQGKIGLDIELKESVCFHRRLREEVIGRSWFRIGIRFPPLPRDDPARCAGLCIGWSKRWATTDLYSRRTATVQSWSRNA
jgi:hypothetical protein